MEVNLDYNLFMDELIKVYYNKIRDAIIYGYWNATLEKILKDFAYDIEIKTNNKITI